MTISNAGISTLIDYTSHIMDAVAVEIAVSKDNGTFRNVARQSYPEKEFSSKKELVKHVLSFDPISARFVRFTVTKATQLPAQMTTAQDKQPFLFIDEIFIY